MLKGFVITLIEGVAMLSRFFAGQIHRFLFFVEWRIPPYPDNVDHNIDMYYRWRKEGIAHWIERGVYNMLAIQLFEKPVVIELCCGDGFFSYYFYSNLAKQVIAVDYDKNVMKRNRWKYKKSNIVYSEMDISKGFDLTMKLNGDVTNIIFDAAMEYFSFESMNQILSEAKELLKRKHGIFSGQLPAAKDSMSTRNTFLHYENRKEVGLLLSKYFENVVVFETNYADRKNFYFYASDGIVPMSVGWEGISESNSVRNFWVGQE